MKPEPVLKPAIWIAAHIRRCESLGLSAFVRKKGDADYGSLLLKLDHFEAGADLLQPVSRLDGGRAWLKLTGAKPQPDPVVEAMIAKRLAREPDMWVLEVEDRSFLHQLDEPVEVT